MCESAVLQLASAAGSALVAAVVADGTVQIWDSRTSERVSEFETFYSFGGHRLALDPTGNLCAAASWNKGKRCGVACYDVQSSQMLWHRTDIKHTQQVRFASDSNSIYCGMEEGPLLRLQAANGETVEELLDVEDVHGSPYSAHVLMVCRSYVFVVEGPGKFRFPRTAFVSSSMRKLPCGLTGIAFGFDSLCVAEAGPVSTMRCLDYTGGERWRLELPKPTGVDVLCYRKADQHFYGVERDVFSSSWRFLVRYSEAGDGVRICPLNSWGEAFCLNGDIIVTIAGDVIETAQGKTTNSLRFPKWAG